MAQKDDVKIAMRAELESPEPFDPRLHPRKCVWNEMLDRLRSRQAIDVFKSALLLTNHRPVARS